MTEFEKYILDHHQDPDILLGNVDTFKQMCRLAEDYALYKVKNLGLFDVRQRALGIESVANLIKSMPADQAIQQIKSELTGLPVSQVIGGNLRVTYVA